MLFDLPWIPEHFPMYYTSTWWDLCIGFTKSSINLIIQDWIAKSLGNCGSLHSVFCSAACNTGRNDCITVPFSGRRNRGGGEWCYSEHQARQVWIVLGNLDAVSPSQCVQSQAETVAVLPSWAGVSWQNSDTKNKVYKIWKQEEVTQKGYRGTVQDCTVRKAQAHLELKL